MYEIWDYRLAITQQVRLELSTYLKVGAFVMKREGMLEDKSAK
jgi:hypothetical protein